MQQGSILWKEKSLLSCDSHVGYWGRTLTTINYRIPIKFQKSIPGGRFPTGKIIGAVEERLNQEYSNFHGIESFFFSWENDACSFKINVLFDGVGPQRRSKCYSDQWDRKMPSGEIV